MSPSLMVFLCLLGVAVIVALAWYARSLWREVKRRERFRVEEIERANRNCLESLDALGQVMRDGQVDLVEGALRSKVLLDILDHRLVENEAFKVFAELEAQAAHLKTHQARKELTPRQRYREDQAREAIAAEYKVRLDAASKALIEYCRERQQVR